MKNLKLTSKSVIKQHETQLKADIYTQSLLNVGDKSTSSKRIRNGSKNIILPKIKFREISPDNLFNNDVNDFYKKNFTLKSILEFDRKVIKKFKF